MLAGDAQAALDAGGGRVVEQRDRETRLAIIARDFAKLTSAERDATIVLDPTRDRRQQLSDAIRAALLREGQDAMTATVFEPRGLSRAETARAASYVPGDIVTFRQQAKGKPRPGIGHRSTPWTPRPGRYGSSPPRAGRTTDDPPAGAAPTPKRS